jgi:hypothetical protein
MNPIDNRFDIRLKAGSRRVLGAERKPIGWLGNKAELSSPLSTSRELFYVCKHGGHWTG